MRKGGKCPKCEGTRIFVCENTQRTHYANGVEPFCVKAVELPKSETGAKEGNQFRSMVGKYETWTCAACAYTEWYGIDHEGLLDKLSRIEGSGVYLLENGRVVGG